MIFTTSEDHGKYRCSGESDTPKSSENGEGSNIYRLCQGSTYIDSTTSRKELEYSKEYLMKKETKTRFKEDIEIKTTRAKSKELKTDGEKMQSYSEHDTCGVCSKTTKKKLVEILVFKFIIE